MNHKGTVTLETSRLVLRRIKLSDSKAMFNNWASDCNVTEFLSWTPHKNEDETKRIITAWVEQYEKKNNYHWVITLKEDIDNPIGTITAVELDDEAEFLHIGYCIGQKWWRQGITSEALKRIIDFFFKEVLANRVESRHDVNNPNSGLVMKKCGMKYEGTLRSRYMGNAGLCDCAFYGLLRNEY